MKKEAIFAIIIGIILGLAITFGIYKFRQTTAPSAEDQIEKIEQQTPSDTTEPSNEKLLITAPKDESILSSSNLRISGNADANEMIVILVNDKEYITQADSIGAFAKDVELDQGGNIIEVTAIAADGKQTTVTQHIVVSTDSLDEKVDATEEATESAKTASSSAKTTSKTPTPTLTKKTTTAPKATATPKEDQ